MLRDAERGRTAAEICAAYGIGISTFYELRNLYGDASVELIERMESLARENINAGRRMAQLEEDVAMLTEALKLHARTSEERRNTVSWLVKRYRVALSRACRLVGISRSFFLYQSSRPDEFDIHAQPEQSRANANRLPAARI